MVKCASLGSPGRNPSCRPGPSRQCSLPEAIFLPVLHIGSLGSTPCPKLGSCWRLGMALQAVPGLGIVSGF